MKRLMFITSVLLASSPAANAYDYVGKFNDWAVYKDTVNGEAVCYATTEANDKAPKSAQHGEVTFYVTYYRSQRTPQNSVRLAFNLREDLPAKAIVSRNSWKLFTVRNEAFADDSDERSIANALKRGSELKVEAMSERNTMVAYHFSLSGSANAIDKAQSLCS
ncbi:MAG: hypothetical protein CMK09_01435 [Ponticaulis sp.]|nr:hypothetical protein [Ponticaulis sp.]|tara:strand:- start:6292 stop:6780 length:489 start_codon:yes stop_codon:yes gene_type:complete